MRIPPYRSPWLAGMLSVALVLPQGLVLNGQAKPASQTPSSAQPKPTTPATPQAKPMTPPSTAKPAAQAAPAGPPAGTNADTGWPRTVTLKSGTAVWYQPQVESWKDQKQVLAWSAVSYLPTGAKEPSFGTIKIEGPTKVSLDD